MPAEVPDALVGELLEVARAAADAGAAVAGRRPSDLQVQDKSSATDHVTAMDLATETRLREVIAAARPHDAVVGEEHGTDSGTSGITWWLDPIDGTTNYVYDLPGWAVSVAAAVDSDHGPRTVAAVVADPTHDRTYWAGLGRGAHCDEQRIRVPDEPASLARMLVASGFSYDADRRARQGRVVADLLPVVRDIRRFGAAALDLCSVAAGRVDAYFEAGLSRWDLAAGVLVATEAGAAVEAIEGGPVRPGSVLAAHPARIDELRELLVSLGARGV